MSNNVVVVVWDTVRGAETVPADPSLTPTLAELAERGTEYPNAFTTAPWTLPAHASLFTGTYPSRHGAHADSTVLDGELPTIAELFRDAGYETMAVSNNRWVTGEFGFTRGFETFRERSIQRTRQRTLRDRLANLGAPSPPSVPRDVPPPDGVRRRLRDGLRSGPRDDGAERSAREVHHWLQSRDDDTPFFLFLNLVEAHLKYRPPPRFGEWHLPEGWSYDGAMEQPQDPRAFDADEFAPSDGEWAALEGLYRAEIDYLDAQLGRLIAALEAAGVRDETLLVVTSDHGENIGDHDLLGHQYTLYDTVLHVPLVVDGGDFSGGTDGSDGLVQTVDLAPTMLDAAGVRAPAAREQFQGRSFHPSSDSPDRGRAFAEYMGPRPPVERLEERFDDVPDRIYRFQRSLRAVRTRGQKYVRGSDGAEELYDLETDPSEVNDLSGRKPGVAADLEATLDEWLSSFDQAVATESPEIGEATRKRLTNMGYM